MAIPCQKKRPCFENFPNVSRDFCVFSHLATPHNTHTIPHAFLSVSSGFQCFPTRTTPHNIHNTQPHTRTHTCTPATDRYLARGLSESVSVNARKNPRKCLKKAKSGKLWRRLVAMLTGKWFVCGEVAKDQCNHLVAGFL